MGLTGKAAEEFHEQVVREGERLRAEAVARAKTEAVTRGKESFDLAKLETLVDPGRMVGPSERQRKYEYMYYVTNPEFMTLAELAELIMVLSEY